MKRRSRRDAVHRRDRGICAACGLDTEALWRSLIPYRDDSTTRARLLERHGYFVWDWTRRRTFWDADHIIPVVAGGSCELDNLRTLCLPCHRGVTLRLQSGPRAEMVARGLAGA